VGIFRKFQDRARDSEYSRFSGIEPADPRLGPIAGVDLVTYVRVVKGAVAGDLRTDAVVAWAESLGVTYEAWQQAGREWPLRMRGDQNLARHYGTLYSQVAA
jgi:hypothetical protein